MIDRENNLDRGHAAMESQDYKSARQFFAAALECGVSDSALHLGWLLEQGLGGEVDIERAAQLYELAANNDRRSGSYYLGALLMKNGQHKRATELLEESAMLGHASGAYWAYVLNGETCASERAAKFLKQAAELGHAFAQRDLARVRMREASSVRQWLSALREYWGAKVRGALLALRDIHDPRIR